MRRMEPGEPVICACEGGVMFRRVSGNPKSAGKEYYHCPKAKETEVPGKWDWGCKFFVWGDDLHLCECGQGPCYVWKNKENGQKVYRCSRKVHKRCDFVRAIPAELSPTTPDVVLRCSPRSGCSSDSSKWQGSGGSAIQQGSSSPNCSSSPSCSNCGLLALKSSILDIECEILKSPDMNTDQSSAAVMEVLEQLKNSLDNLMLSP